MPRLRPPTDPEIETYLEIEADEPPESGLDAELESELALNIVFSGDLDRAGDPGSARLDDGHPRATDTATEVRTQITVTLHEPGHEPPVRKRAITAQDSSSVSGTISIPDDGDAPPPRRTKRQSDGWDK